ALKIIRLHLSLPPPPLSLPPPSLPHPFSFPPYPSSLPALQPHFPYALFFWPNPFGQSFQQPFVKNNHHHSDTDLPPPLPNHSVTNPPPPPSNHSVTNPLPPPSTKPPSPSLSLTVKVLNLRC
ncbi:hypothetical protein ACB092_12G092500, partial [Castanea dentata]